jgi:hypothetical protein
MWQLCSLPGWGLSPTPFAASLHYWPLCSRLVLAAGKRGRPEAKRLQPRRHMRTHRSKCHGRAHHLNSLGYKFSSKACGMWGATCGWLKLGSAGAWFTRTIRVLVCSRGAYPASLHVVSCLCVVVLCVCVCVCVCTAFELHPRTHKYQTGMVERCCTCWCPPVHSLLAGLSAAAGIVAVRCVFTHMQPAFVTFPHRVLYTSHTMAAEDGEHVPTHTSPHTHLAHHTHTHCCTRIVRLPQACTQPNNAIRSMWSCAFALRRLPWPLGAAL